MANIYRLGEMRCAFTQRCRSRHKAFRVITDTPLTRSRATTAACFAVDLWERVPRTRAIVRTAIEAARMKLPDECTP